MTAQRYWNLLPNASLSLPLVKILANLVQPLQRRREHGMSSRQSAIRNEGLRTLLKLYTSLLHLPPQPHHWNFLQRRSHRTTRPQMTTRGQVRGFLRYNSNILPHAIHLLYIRHTHSPYVSRSTTGSSMTTPFCPSLIPRSPPRLRFRPRKASQLKIRSFTFQRVQNPKVITMGREMIKEREGRKRRSHRFLPYILHWIP